MKRPGHSSNKKMLSTKRGLQAVARWMMKRDLLHQFLLAKKQIDWVEGRNRAKKGDDEDGKGKGVERAEENESEITEAE